MNIYQRVTLIVGGVIISIIIFSTLSNIDPNSPRSLHFMPSYVLLALGRGMGVLIPTVLIYFAFKNLKGKK